MDVLRESTKLFYCQSECSFTLAFVLLSGVAHSHTLSVTELNSHAKKIQTCVCLASLTWWSICLQRLMGPDGMSLVNGTTGVHGDDYWTEAGVSQGRPPSPQNPSQTQSQPQRQVSDVYSNTLPVRRPQPAKNKTTVGKRNQSFCISLLKKTAYAG